MVSPYLERPPVSEAQSIAESAGFTRRRALIGGLALLFAAPAIVRASSLMHIKTLPEPVKLIIPEWNLVQRLVVQLQPDGNWKVLRVEGQT